MSPKKTIFVELNHNTMKTTKTYLKELTYKINGAAIEVHKALGPGLLESVYHKCLFKELELMNIKFQSQAKVPYSYKGLYLDIDLRADFIIENLIVVELKSVEVVLPIHEAQLLTYMKLLQIPKGILINFNVVNIFHKGQKTFVNEYYRDLPE